MPLNTQPSKQYARMQPTPNLVVRAVRGRAVGTAEH